MFGLRLVNINYLTAWFFTGLCDCSESACFLYLEPVISGERKTGEDLAERYSPLENCTGHGFFPDLLPARGSLFFLSLLPLLPFLPSALQFLFSWSFASLGICLWWKRASFPMLTRGYPGLLLKNQKLCPNRGDTFFFFFLNKDKCIDPEFKS